MQLYLQVVQLQGAVQCLVSRSSESSSWAACSASPALPLALGQTLMSHFPLPAEVVASRATTSPWVAALRSLSPALFKGIGLFQRLGCVIRVFQASIPVVWSSEMEHRHCRER